MIIYKATNNIDGMSYIGKTIQKFSKRKRAHQYSMKHCTDITSRFHNALRCHGWDNFTWEVLKECDNQLILNLLETFMIMVHKTHNSENGYNMTWGGDGTSGHKFTDEQNKRKSERQRGRKQTTEWVNKRIECYVGKKRTKQQCKNISDSLKGRKLSLEHIKKCWEHPNFGMKGKTHSIEAKLKMSESRKAYLEKKRKLI